ncbi:MAG: hypothetical protein ABIS50_22480 [Luteolibacter sp.]|uniref:hypothetical protein n=1 Tax=Luteolibacter sp. TaxID=1962973 RepID=UPI0032667283
MSIEKRQRFVTTEKPAIIADQTPINHRFRLVVLLNQKHPIDWQRAKDGDSNVPHVSADELPLALFPKLRFQRRSDLRNKYDIDARFSRLRNERKHVGMERLRFHPIPSIEKQVDLIEAGKDMLAGHAPNVYPLMPGLIPGQIDKTDLIGLHDAPEALPNHLGNDFRFKVNIRIKNPALGQVINNPPDRVKGFATPQRASN